MSPTETGDLMAERLGSGVDGVITRSTPRQAAFPTQTTTARSGSVTREGSRGPHLKRPLYTSSTGARVAQLE